MKKFAGKNQLIITALAVLIAVAGYLNFTGQEIDKNGLKSVMSLSGKQTAAPADTTLDISAEEEGSDYTVAYSGELKSASEENPGEAVMVSNNIGSDYFASSKLNREQSRDKNKETLMNIINDDKIASADKKSAIKQVAAMTKISEKENAAELMLQAKGFENAMVSISSGNADVIVSSEGLTNKQIAQIEDIVKRKTGITADKIVITPVNVK